MLPRQRPGPRRALSPHRPRENPLVQAVGAKQDAGAPWEAEHTCFSLGGDGERRVKDSSAHPTQRGVSAESTVTVTAQREEGRVREGEAPESLLEGENSSAPASSGRAVSPDASAQTQERGVSPELVKCGAPDASETPPSLQPGPPPPALVCRVFAAVPGPQLTGMVGPGGAQGCGQASRGRRGGPGAVALDQLLSWSPEMQPQTPPPVHCPSAGGWGGSVLRALLGAVVAAEA